MGPENARRCPYTLKIGGRTHTSPLVRSDAFESQSSEVAKEAICQYNRDNTG
ncbi:hypothetical protein DsansV1_C14g0128191 [Dioscorea sansibarensis]